MKRLSRPSKVNYDLKIPGSKSFLQRALFISAFAKGTKIYNPNYCLDVEAAIELIKQFGAKVEQQFDYLLVQPAHKLVSAKWDCKESGFCFRSALALSGLFSQKIRINGNGSLLRRDFSQATSQLNKLGLHTCSKQFPLDISGQYHFDRIELDGSNSSQFISGVFMGTAIAGMKAEIGIKKLTSEKYVDLTVAILKEFGAKIVRENDSFFFYPSKLDLKEIEAESDWSNAAFFLVAGAIAGKTKLRNLNPNSYQPDKKILQILKQTGADLEIG
jgi:3-phosphoshikimate 1-carboxyvinyltransferase